jgi:hypothetical protein
VGRGSEQERYECGRERNGQAVHPPGVCDAAGVSFLSSCKAGPMNRRLERAADEATLGLAGL